ncbi:ParA family protein [Pediococcus pentosaceus]|uniref:ParA family protein n=1 Tax=Pediococcus pentosaceus TaxID=1255 RepID=UPI002F2664ED
MTATVYTVGNFKGGVGKTKLVTMLAYDNAILRDKKTLIIDMDPQANASQIMAKTADIKKIDKTITDGITEGSLGNCITNIEPNLDLLACDTHFRSFAPYVLSLSDEQEQVRVIEKLIEPLKDKYHSIFIDVPPTISEFSDNAMAASDYSIIACQTQEESLDGVSKYVGYQNFMIEKFGIDLQVIAIVPCMVEPDDQLDQTILKEARDEYGDAVLDTVITYQKRLKRYSREGIHLNTYKNGNYDQWDFKAHNSFNLVLNEVEGRKAYLEGK